MTREPREKSGLRVDREGDPRESGDIEKVLYQAQADMLQELIMIEDFVKSLIN